MIRTATKTSFSIWEFCLILILLHNLMPVGHFMPAFVYGVLVLSYYILLFERIGSSCSQQYIVKFIPILFLSLLNMIFGIVHNNNTAVLDLYQMMQILVMPTAAFTLLQEKNIVLTKRVVLIICLGILATCVTTILGNIKTPGASRLLAGTVTEGDAEFELFRSLNIGGFSFAYILTLISPILALCFKRTNHKTSFLFLLALVLVGVTLKYEDYTTALFLFFVSVILIAFPVNFSAKKLIIFVIIALLFLELLLPVVFDVIQKVTGDLGTTSDKLVDLQAFLNGEDLGAESDVYARNMAFTHSWEVFLKNPILGSWSGQGIGGHSLILDSMAKYGLFGLLAVFLMFRNVYTYFIKPFNNEIWYGFILWSFSMSIFLTLLNTQVIWIVIAFILPLSCMLLSEQYKND